MEKYFIQNRDGYYYREFLKGLCKHKEDAQTYTKDECDAILPLCPTLKAIKA